MLRNDLILPREDVLKKIKQFENSLKCPEFKGAFLKAFKFYFRKEVDHYPLSSTQKIFRKKILDKPEDFLKICTNLIYLVPASGVVRSINSLRYIENNLGDGGDTTEDTTDDKKDVNKKNDLVVLISTDLLHTSVYTTLEIFNLHFRNLIVSKPKFEEILTAIHYHDWPELLTGDDPDINDDDSEKHQLEYDFLNKIGHVAIPSFCQDEFYNSFKYIEEIQNREGIGLTDKAAAPILKLVFEFFGIEYSMDVSREDFKPRETKIRDSILTESPNAKTMNPRVMWTKDFIEVREFAKKDETLFLIAIIIMLTLIVDGKWPPRTN